MATFDAFHTSFKAFLQALNLTVLNMPVKRVFHGNLNANPQAANLPYISFEIDTESTNWLTMNTKNKEISVEIQVWLSGLKNETTVEAAKTACRSIFDSWAANTSTRLTYGILDDMTCSIDHEPLVNSNAVGCKMTINMTGSET